MQASTASACLRKLSDSVNLVSKPHAALRSSIVSYLCFPDLSGIIFVFVRDFHVSAEIFLDFSCIVAQITHQVRNQSIKFGSFWFLWEARSGPLPNLDGYNACSSRFQRSSPLRSLPAGP